MKPSPKLIGLLQAIGLAAYITLFAFLVQTASNFSPLLSQKSLQPIFGMIFFLSAFVISALICGSIALVNPVQAFLSGKKKEALEIILWNIFWLMVLFIIFSTVIAISSLLIQ